MERCIRRRNSLLDELFGDPVDIGPGRVRPLRADRGFGGTRELAVVSDEADDLLFVPGVLSAAVGSAAHRRLAGDKRFREASGGTGGVAVFVARRRDAVEAVATSLGLLAEFAAEGLAPVHGFVVHQKMKAGEDPELTEPLIAPRRAATGSGRHVALLDTGLAASLPWGGGELRSASRADLDPLASLIDARYLGRAAGHGTFVAGLCNQLVPSARVEVGRIANTEGFVDELTLAVRLDKIGAGRSPAPDVVLLCFGGYSVKLGSFGTPSTGGADSWTHPALLLSSLRALLARCPGTVVVASAGNNESSDPCFPAAFAGWEEFADRVVAVAALDGDDRRWAFSNYGEWVSASARGVRLRSIYVTGEEHPDNDPDGSPENFTEPFASWSGTSFAAPLVASRILQVQDALRDCGQGSTSAVDAWRLLRSISPRLAGCGTVIKVEGVAHD